MRPRPHFRLEPSIQRALLAGLVLRLLLMPFAAHSDLLHTYWNAHVIAYHHRPVGFEALLYYFHAGYLWLIAPLLPPTDSIWVHSADDPFLNPFLGPEMVSTQGWLDFVSHPQVYRMLFLLKVPYLLFDLGCAILLYSMGSDRVKSRRMLVFWWLNPILIFAVYIYGRHEAIALFFVILSLYLILRGRESWGLFALGLAIAIRYYIILLLPFYVLSIQPKWKKRLQGLIIGVTPWSITNFATWVVTGLTEAERLISFHHTADTLLAIKLPIAAWDNLYIFPLVYCLLLLHRLYNQEYGLRSLEQYCLISLLLLFATAYTGQSPHYWTWLLPWLAIGVAEDQRLLPLHAAQIACLIVYSFIGSRSTAGYLFAPVFPDLFWSLPSPIEYLRRFAAPEVVISMAQTAFSAVSLWMAYLVFRQLPATVRGDGHPKD